EALHPRSQHREVEHVVGLGVEPASHDAARAVVVTVQLLAAMPAERDDVGRGEDEIVFGPGDLESPIAGHATLLPAAPRRWPRPSGPRWRPGSAYWPRLGARGRGRRWRPGPPSCGRRRRRPRRERAAVP